MMQSREEACGSCSRAEGFFRKERSTPAVFGLHPLLTAATFLRRRGSRRSAYSGSDIPEGRCFHQGKVAGLWFCLCLYHIQCCGQNPAHDPAAQPMETEGRSHSPADICSMRVNSERTAVSFLFFFCRVGDTLLILGAPLAPPPLPSLKFY